MSFLLFNGSVILWNLDIICVHCLICVGWLLMNPCRCCFSAVSRVGVDKAVEEHPGRKQQVGDGMYVGYRKVVMRMVVCFRQTCRAVCG